MNQDFLKTILNSNRIETSALTSTEEQMVRDAIAKYKKDNRIETIEIYADYRDELPEKDIQKILEAKNPSDAFYEIIDDYYIDYDDSYDVKSIREDLDLDEDFVEEAINEIDDIIRDEFPIELPYNHYLKAEVPVDIFLREGEDTVSEVITFDDEGKAIDVPRSVVWLLERQGYSVEEFLNYYNSLEDFDRGTGKTNYDKNSFFGSIAQELDNFTGGSLVQLVFLGSINLEDYIKGFEYIHIPKDAICGLVDTYSGAGSVLEINLEKPINLPKDEIRIYHKDGYRYNIDEIYGLSSGAWKADIQLKGSEE